MPHRKAAKICIRMGMHRASVRDRVPAREIVSREAVRGTVREIAMEHVPRGAAQKAVHAETAQKAVLTGKVRETVLGRIKDRVFREAAREIVFRETVPECVREAARETVLSGIETGTVTVTEIIAARPSAVASVVPGVREPIGMTGILLLRRW